MHRLAGIMRHNEEIELFVGVKGMQIRFTEVTTWYNWDLIGYPKSFIDSAREALGPYKGYHSGFSALQHQVSGRFSNQDKDKEWLDLFTDLPNFKFHMKLRHTEVENLINLIEEYWSD